MIEINGELGEGGGQILRTSIALSSLLNKPVKIINIRKKRKNPGLRPQHMMAIKILSKLTESELKGVKEGSMEIEYLPKRKIAKNMKFDVGTAGSIPLLIQAITPYMIFLDKPITIEFIGGTNVRWSPPIDYLQRVFVPLLNKMNIKLKIELLKRGFYPKGGGRVKLSSEPVDYIKPINLDKNQKLKQISGISYASNLPIHVVKRQAKAALDYLNSENLTSKVNVNIEIENPTQSFSAGSGIVLVANLDKDGIIGSDELGERGIPAETVGRNAAINLTTQIKSGASVDKNMADMLTLYMALARGKSTIYASDLTSHLLTNIKIIEKFLDVKFEIVKSNKIFKITVNGLGFKA
ncbi:MAG: RNA 3'-terminal phosphate cyclase [Candidatus Odinarchaeia archaeon]